MQRSIDRYTAPALDGWPHAWTFLAQKHCNPNVTAQVGGGDCRTPDASGIQYCKRDIQ